MELIKKLYKGEEGQGLTEYGLLLAAVVVVVAAAVTLLTGNMTELFTSVGDYLKTAVTEVTG